MAEHGFGRTTCGCAACVACCKEQPGPLAPGDFERIAAYLGRAVADTLDLFWASPGAVVANSRTGRRWRVPTITPRLRAGRCVFLGSDDRCAVHPVAPFGCAYVDTHMASAEWAPPAQWLYTVIETDATYQAFRRMLTPATSWRPRTGEGGS